MTEKKTSNRKGYLAEQIRGVSSVFRFSFKQHIADASFRILTGVMSFILLIILPCFYWFMVSNGGFDPSGSVPAMSGYEQTSGNSEQTAYLSASSDASASVAVSSMDGNDLISGLVGMSDNWREYMLIALISVLTVVLVAVAGDRISFSMVTEKSSKLIEFLLTVVRPTALVIGKILACMCAVLIQLTCMGLALFFGWRLTQLFAGGTLNLNLLLSAIPGELHILPVGVVAAIFFFILAVLFYGLSAARIGAGVSRVEDNGDNLKVFNLMLYFCSALSMICARLDSQVGSNLLTSLIELCPLTSPFIVPSYLALGKISIGMATASFVIMILSMVFLLAFVSTVYEALIFYRGEPLHIRKVLARLSEHLRERRHSI